MAWNAPRSLFFPTQLVTRDEHTKAMRQVQIKVQVCKPYTAKHYSLVSIFVAKYLDVEREQVIYHIASAESRSEASILISSLTQSLAFSQHYQDPFVTIVIIVGRSIKLKKTLVQTSVKQLLKLFREVGMAVRKQGQVGWLLM